MKKSILLRLIVVSILIKIVVTLKRLPGSHIDTWIRLWSIQYAKKLGISRVFELLVHPISGIRYFEFDFVFAQLTPFVGQKVLDVSSPRSFALYYCKRNERVNYTMVNPDHLDVKETIIQASAFGLANFNVQMADARALPFLDEKFDCVVCVSVIEHIKGSGDIDAIKEMWRVLKPGGKLILTTHIAKQKRVEYRTTDQYNLTRVKRKKYFFQRVYDEESFQERILSQIPTQAYSVKIWGEKEKGWFDAYINRWIKRGLAETVWDPWHMSTRFKAYDYVEQLPGIGVIGSAFKKPL